MNEGFALFSILVLVFLLGVLIGSSPWDKSTEELRQEAIKAGVAERVIIDPVTGKTQFKWKESK